MKVDYIVVGFGLAGMAFVAELEKANKSFVVFDDNPNRSTRVVGGMYNPIILKRFTPAWKAHEMWQIALPFYKELERKFNKEYIFPIQIRRILKSIEEQNNWVVASDKAVMSVYMDPNLIHEEVKGLQANYGFGVINHVGRVAGETILEDYKNNLIQKQKYIKQSVDYHKIHITTDQIKYQDIEARKMIFSEGAYLPNNPFFNYLPIQAAKGEMLIIEVPDLAIDFTVKSGVFMVPLGNHQYIIGANYNWKDKTFKTTKEAQEEIESKLKKFLKLPYKLVDYKVGIRPTIKDRRPLIGKHPKYSNLAILNGLGTRGVIIAPAIAKILVEHLENNAPIPKEMHSKRFANLYN
jgi:glycine/D-amino acid oxidase-like deaminating enzyme